MANERPDGHIRRWAASPPVQERHKAALKALAAVELPKPGPLSGDGIVLVGGGRYWPMLTIAVRMCRQFSGLPIDVWYRGVDEPIHPDHLADLPNVRLRDLTQLRPRPRILGGWEQKTVAILASGFRRVFFLDADAYLVSDPGPLFARLDTAPFVYWQDLGSTNANVNWRAYFDGRPEFPPQVQGGQLLLDIPRCYRTLLLAHWLNMHSDYSYNHQYGDQDSWRVALALSKEPYLCLGQARWQEPAFVCEDNGARVVHRCRGKLWCAGADKFSDALPGEASVRRYHAMVSLPPATPAMLFEGAYQAGKWGRPNTCGAGSNEQERAPYLLVANAVLAALGARSAADLACGDGVVTAGLVVPQLYAVDCVALHGQRVKVNAPKALWYCADLLAQLATLPAADVWLLKDVLHHWPTAAVDSWLSGWAKSGLSQYLIATFDTVNAVEGADCPMGGYRPLEPSTKPLAYHRPVVLARYLHKVVCLFTRPTAKTAQK